MDNFPFLTQAVANTLKTLRKNCGLSKSKLAKESTVNRVYIIQLEQGKYRPTLNTLFYLAKAFKMSIIDMVEMIDEETERLTAYHQAFEALDTLTAETE